MPKFNLPHPMVIIEDVLSLLYPRLCLICNAQVQQGDYICISCEHQLPKTDLHWFSDNEFTQKFYGRLKIEFGAACYLYGLGNKTKFLIHQLKYGNKPMIGFRVGLSYGEKLKESPILPEADAIIPVPLHPKRFHQRGYNQSEWFGRGLSESLEIPLDIKTLLREEYTQTQTRKTRLNRFENVKTAFKVTNSTNFNGKHVILVDDVLTTGATLEACALTLQQLFPTIRLSMITMAIGES